MDAREKLIQDLNLNPGDDYTQDWECEASDYKRVGEFLSYYKETSLQPEEKKALIEVILNSYESYVKVAGFDAAYTEEIKRILDEGHRLFLDTIEYWACLGEEVEDSFYITPIVREVRDAILFRNYRVQDVDLRLTFSESILMLNKSIVKMKEMIDMIHGRSGMFVSEERVDYIEHFFFGWWSGVRCERREAGIMYSSRVPGIWHMVCVWIYDWIEKNMDKNCKFSFHWHQMLYSVTNNEEEALALFYKICDDILQEVTEEDMEEYRKYGKNA
ncbi:MAG: hypothetical protein HFH23_15630 [Ruminococcus sp.]|nr:hypothetical protein [Ruminococcus sp.]